MRKEKETTISGTKFKVTQLGFADGIELLTTMGRLIGPILSSGPKEMTDLIFMGHVMSKLTQTEVLNMIEKLAKATRVEREAGRWPTLEPEVDLAGKYDLTLRWLKFVLEVNYQDFFVSGGLLENAIDLARAPQA